MAIFITQGRYTHQTMKGLVAAPEDRSIAVKAHIESFGGKLLAWYLTFGEYDFLAITEISNEKAMLSGLAVVAAGGGVSDLKTTMAMTGADAKKAFAAAGKSASKYKPAGQS